MTFEEFFNKKKIDLAQLAKADPDLFSEFKTHFALMGEKSFDHTKKFWFNKLRLRYHLKEESKPTQEIQAKTPVAVQAETLPSPTIQQQPTAGAVLSKPAFKPRFNSKNIPVKKETDTPAEKAVDALPTESKPVYKPRFKPVNLPDKAVQEPSALPEDKPPVEENPVKPAYKPRFNPKNIPAKSEVKAETPAAMKEEKLPPAQEQAPTEQTPTAKPAYKPRFNMKNIKPKTDE